MKEFLTKVSDRKFDIEDPEFVDDAFKHRRFIRIEGTLSEIRMRQDITEDNTIKDVRLSSRGYKVVGRRKLFQ
jgi:hypothetical protein